MRDLSAAMAGCGNGNAGLRDRCPRCDVCGKVVRVRGVGVNGVWCVSCLSDALPFVGLNGEGEFKAALREYREGLGNFGSTKFVQTIWWSFDRGVQAV